MIKIEIKNTNTWADTDLSLFVSFPFNTALVSTIKALPYRYWRNELKAWETPFNCLTQLIKAFSAYEMEITADSAEVFAPKKDVKAQINFAFKTSPFEHQIEGLNFGLEHKRWLLGDEQGLGKTKQVIDIAVAQKQLKGYAHCLIICGVNGLKWNWVEEVKTHSDEKAWIIGQQTGKNGKVSIGSTAEKSRQLDALANNEGAISDAYFIITNVESLRNEELVQKLSDLCTKKVIGLVAADEVHKMKNPMCQQGKGFLKIQAETMIAMTGTPLMNSPLDLYIILKWLGYERHSFYSFKNHYCEMGGYGNYQIVGYKHLEDLQAQLNEFMLRRLKSEVLDLPEKTFINEYVEMTAKQASVYKEIHSSIMANIDMVKKATNPLAEMIRLRQATGFTGILSSTIKESAKLDRLLEIVDDAVQNNKKVVVFSNWTQMTDVVYDKLIEAGHRVAQITGDTPDNQRQSIVNDYQNTNKINVLIGTIGAMGTGLTLTAGTVEVFLDEPWNMALKDQAVDRCHRIGQKNNITVYTLLTKNTIDERIHELVTEKGAMADMLVDGKVAGDKSAIVDYLLS